MLYTDFLSYMQIIERYTQFFRYYGQIAMLLLIEQASRTLKRPNFDCALRPRHKWRG